MAGVRATDDRRWILETEESAYVLGVDGGGGLRNCYWGERLGSDYPAPEGAVGVNTDPGNVREEYPPDGGYRFGEPALKVAYDDGVRDLELAVRDASATDDTLAVTLADPDYDLRVELSYALDGANDLVSRRATVANGGEAPVRLEQVASGQLHPRLDDYRLTALPGEWGAEAQLSRTRLPQGKRVLESREGITGHRQNPWFAVDDGTATERTGAVHFGALAWSGNWKLAFERDARDRLRVTGGVNDYDFAWRLDPGGQFETPRLVAGHTREGFGGASRRLHRHQLDRVLPEAHRESPLPVSYASWGLTHFDVEEIQQMELAEAAADLGVELFFVDDGWFRGRDDDTAGLGDWEPDPGAFPDGLGPLADHVHDLGMAFGLWVEPEMVSPGSDLHREHPEWVYGTERREQTAPPYARNQLVLDLCREDVREHLFGVLDGLATDCDLDFLKWDMNRYLAGVARPGAPAGRHREVWVRHVRGVHDLLDRLREHHPELLIQGCAAGGGRTDLAMVERVDLFTPTDNPGSYADYLEIFEGLTQAYPTRAVGDPLPSAPHGVDLRELSPDERESVADDVARYKRLREVIQRGDLYRLRSPREGEVTAFEWVTRDRDRAVLFTHVRLDRYRDATRPIRLRGLEPDARYAVESPRRDRTFERGGRSLHERGVEPALSGDGDREVVELRRID